MCTTNAKNNINNYVTSYKEGHKLIPNVPFESNVRTLNHKFVNFIIFHQIGISS